MKNYKSSLTLARAAMTLLIALLTTTTAWAQDAITGLTYNSTGGYYEISDAQDLIDLANYVNGGNNASDKTFKQTQDITLTEAVAPIGNSSSKVFKGTYDGGGYSISGLNVSSIKENGFTCSGLFGKIEGANLHDIVLISPIVSTSVANDMNTYVGPIVGYMSMRSTSPQVSNCTVINPTVSLPDGFTGNAGAIIGYIRDGRATNCHFYGGNQSDAIGSNLGYSPVNVSRVYTLTATGCTATATATVVAGTSCYYNSGTAVTLCHDEPAAGYLFGGYTSDNVTITDGAFTMPAADVAITATVTPDPAHFSDNGDGSYTIKTADGWNVFCDALQDNDTWNRFIGKTVKLGDDIGSAENPVTRMAGSDNHDFCGTFDGDEHTITLDGNSANGCYTLFRNAVGATIRDLHVTGTITTAGKYAAGFISGMWGNVTIENCRSSVIIRSSVSGDGTHGGFVAVNNSGTLDITGCTFDGKLLTTGTTATSHCGGFVGWNAGTLTITNSLYAPADLADGETEVIDGTSNPSATFARNGATITNSYYTLALGTAQGKACHSVTAGENVTIEAVALTGTATQYNVSGITAYIDGGLQRGETLYYGSGDQLSLTLSNSATAAPQGYQYGYTASAGTLDGTTLTMPDEDVTISVNTAALAIIDWATVNQGNSKDPYMIYNKDQLLLLAHRVNGTNDETANDYKGKYFKLGADITFDHLDNEGDDYAENYEAIGGYQGGYTYRHFRGNFNGDNKTVSGIRIRKTGDGDADSYQGLFGMITGGANIHDVHLTDARIKSYYYVGGIVGYNNGSTVSGCTVTDSYITATKEPTNNYGTICGWNSNSTLRNNYYHGCTVNGTAVTSGKGCQGADINDNNGALPAYAITLGDGVSTTALASAPENGFVYNGVSYYREGLALPLASEAPEGYTLSFSANGTALSGNTYTVNTTDGDVTITAAIRSDGLQHEVSYVDADGTNKTHLAIALDGTETSLAAGWYFVGKDIDYTATVTLGGDVSLILADGCTMNIGSSGSRINGNGIAREGSGDQTLTIYGQTAGTGTLSIYTDNGNGIAAKAVTINGGNVTIDANGQWSTGIYAGVGNIIINSGNVNVTATGDNTWGLYANANVNVNGGNVNATGGSSGIRTDNGDITINGGNVTATGSNNGIYTSSSNGGITLGYTNSTDYILSSGYEIKGTAKVADGQALADESDHIYTGTLTAKQLAAIANQKLTPVNLYVINGNSDETVSFTEQKEHATVIYNRNFTKGVTSTIVLPFDFDATALAGALHTISSIGVQDGKWVATASDAIPEGKANTPYLFKPNSDIVSTTFKDVTIVPTEESTTTIGESNWQMKGVYQFKEWDADSPSDYGFAGAAQESTEGEAIKAGDFVRVGKGAKIRATRCYLTYDNGISKASPILPDRITVIFPDATASVIEPQPADPSGDTDPSGDITTPISEIAAQSGTKVWGYDGTIYIESQPYTPYTMIDLAGRTLRNGVTNSTREEVALSRPAGIVIVRIGGKTFKIFNR